MPHDIAHQEKDKGSVQHREVGGAEADSDAALDRAAERRLLRKLDLLIVPLTAMLYLSAYLDRGNIGNAKLLGLLDILHGDKDTQFSILLAAFYITYIVFIIPGNILGATIRPNHALALGALTWSAASAAMAATHNLAGALVCRLLIGVGEAGFGAAVPLYYGLWYRRDEVATRISWYIGAGSLAGAFGGLIAYGVSFIHGPIAPWRVLFLIEGLPSLVLALVIFLFLPSTPERSGYISPEERDLIHARLADAGVSHTHTFDRSALPHVFRSRTTYLNGLVYLGLNLSLGSVSGFLPTVIKSFGTTSSARAQLLTVPPYAVAFVGTLAVSSLSDRARRRGVFVVALMLLSAVGFTILLAVHNSHARYFATFLVVLGAFSNIPLMLSWAANTSGSHSAAAVRLGFMNSVGQCFSILAAFIFPSAEGPHWYKGFGLNLAFNVVSAATAAYLSFYYARENAKRDVAEAAAAEESVDEKAVHSAHADVPTNLHDQAPGFRYYV
ncbi:hypothetical protein Q8F55_003729 [Vanrija albida]|uniref:Major facilitator superfamily (MFS) profile domain-containing protein n=1 Tax=Vanrija albida TaxID=181172 RepID=A0ABR3Q5J6_9TREE